MTRKSVGYELASPHTDSTEWMWSCNICYQHQYYIADEVTAKRLADQHAEPHGVKAVKN